MSVTARGGSCPDGGRRSCFSDYCRCYYVVFPEALSIACSSDSLFAVLQVSSQPRAGTAAGCYSLWAFSFSASSFFTAAKIGSNGPHGGQIARAFTTQWRLAYFLLKTSALNLPVFALRTGPSSLPSVILFPLSSFTNSFSLGFKRVGNVIVQAGCLWSIGTDVEAHL